MLESVSTTQHVHQSLRAEVHPEAINCAERGRPELLHGHVLATQLLRLHDFQSVKTTVEWSGGGGGAGAGAGGGGEVFDLGGLQICTVISALCCDVKCARPPIRYTTIENAASHTSPARIVSKVAQKNAVFYGVCTLACGPQWNSGDIDGRPVELSKVERNRGEDMRIILLAINQPARACVRALAEADGRSGDIAGNGGGGRGSESYALIWRVDKIDIIVLGFVFVFVA